MALGPEVRERLERVRVVPVSVVARRRCRRGALCVRRLTDAGGWWRERPMVDGMKGRGPPEAVRREDRCPPVVEHVASVHLRHVLLLRVVGDECGNWLGEVHGSSIACCW